jgi:phosphopantetheinyl transferase (holo-ACP synthase)
MTNTFIKIHNVETGEIIEREMTAEEIAQHKIDEENAKVRAAKLAAKNAAKQAVLDKLGLTADEVAALLG